MSKGVMSVKGMDALQTSFCENDSKKVLISKKCEPTNFRNNCHSVRILEDLQSQRKNEVLCDVRFEADDGKLVIGHKNVLIAASPYFRAMFSNIDESNKDIVKIRELDSAILQQLVDNIYTGEIMITEENVQGLLPASNILQLDYVKDACAKFLQAQLDSSNCLRIKAFADLHNCMELLLSSEDFIKKQFIEVVKCDDFLSLSYEAVVKLISSNDLTVPFEEKRDLREYFGIICIYNAYDHVRCVDHKVLSLYILLRYMNVFINHELDCRIEFLPGLMEHLRLPLASLEYIFKKVVDEPLIKNNSKCMSYVVEALQFHFHKKDPLITIPQTIRCSFRQPGGFQKVILVLGWDDTLNKSCLNWYDTTTNKWEITPEMTKCRFSAGLSIIKDHFLFAVGGVDESSSKDSRSVEMLDLTSQSPIWVPTVDMLVSRRFLGVAELDDCIYAVGGDEDDADLNSVEVFDISIQKWRMVSNMTTERSCMGMGVLSNRIYAIGGLNDSGRLNSVECYDPSLDKWTTVTDMSGVRSSVSVGVLNGVIYAIGGRNESGVLKSVEAYKPSDGVWTSVADMHECRASAGVVAFGGLLYVMGGYSNNVTCKSFEIYNPVTNLWKIESVNSNTIGNMYAALVVNRPPHFRSN